MHIPYIFEPALWLLKSDKQKNTPAYHTGNYMRAMVDNFAHVDVLLHIYEQ